MQKILTLANGKLTGPYDLGAGQSEKLSISHLLQDFSVNSQTYKVRRKTASPEKTRTGATSAASLATSSPTMATLSPSEAAGVSPEVEVWGSHLRSRGAFYLEGDSVICHQYQLSLPVAGLCRIAVQV